MVLNGMRVCSDGRLSIPSRDRKGAVPDPILARPACPRKSRAQSGPHTLVRAFGVAALCVFASSAAAVSAELDEYQAKAAFLYKFTKFVEWPEGAFKAPADSVAICVLGETPFEQSVDATVRNKQVDGRAFAVRQVSDAKQVAGCHLLFVASHGVKRFRTLRAELTAVPGLLVVGESEGFAAEGGVINFKLSGGRLRIEINVAAARHAGLVINSRLLGMADLVER